ncbi:hypothetical protein Goklo_003746, partial [Gossypium klotzschianum]|nr:hypothetical protein [Gossypium klotzschianum]
MVSTLIVLICGFNHTRLVLFVETPLLLGVSSGSSCLDEGSSASSASIGSSAMASTSSRQEGMLVIDVPMNGNENPPEEESKSAMPTRLR